jgi:hypothetical protein
MRAFGLVDWDRHGQDTDSPASQDTASEDHTKMLGGGLEHSTDQVDDGAEHDCLSASKTVHSKTSPIYCQAPSSLNGCFAYIKEPKNAPWLLSDLSSWKVSPTYSRKCRIDGPYDI